MNKLKFLFFFAVGFFASCVCNGCGSDSRPTACKSDDECAPYEICIDDVCTEVECKTDIDCQDGERCVDFKCVSHVECQVDGDCEPGRCDLSSHECVECTMDSHCEIGFICESNACVSGCRQDSECISGKCIQETNTCAECTDNGDCINGNICVDWSCVPGCESDTDCPPDTVCAPEVGDHGTCAQCWDDGDCQTPGEVCIDNHCVQHVEGNLLWAKKIGSPQDVECRSVAALDGDSLILVGGFQATATFGAGESSETVLTAAGIADVFLARYNSDGTVAWAKSAGGANGDRAQAIESLAGGSFLLTGYFSSSATWGAGESSESILDAAGMTDAFLARYNDDGTIAWVKRAGGTGSDEGIDLATAADGTTILVGAFEETAVFGLGETAETILVTAGGSDGFFAKYNPDGTIAWAKKIGGSGQDSVRGVSLLADGSFLVAGHLSGTVVFGMGEPNETHSDGTWGVFLAKYDGNGQLQWAKGISKDGDVNVEIGGISGLSDGSFRITGGLGGSGSIVFGKGEIDGVSVSSEDQFHNAYVAGYDPDGTFKWVKTTGGSDSQKTGGFDLTLLNNDSVVTVGSFGGTVLFGNGENSETELTSDGKVDAFIAKLAP